MSAATAMRFAPRRIERVLLIVNPASRRGNRIRTKTLKAFADAGVDCDLMLTEAPGHAAVLAKAHAHKYDAVFTLGGDGTVMEVLGALAHQGPPIGILAGGTANVVARTLRIPLNPARAVPLLLRGDEASMDLGRLGDGRRFAIGVGVGLDATMISEAPPRLKKRFGFMAYVIGGYKAVLRNQKFSLRLTIDTGSEFWGRSQRSGRVRRRDRSRRWGARRLRVLARHPVGCAQNSLANDPQGFQPRSLPLLQIGPGIQGGNDPSHDRAGRR